MDLYPYCDVNLLKLQEDDERALSLISKQFFSPARLRTSAMPLKTKLDRRYEIDTLLERSPVRDDLYRIGNLKSEKHSAQNSWHYLSTKLRKA